MSVDVLTARMEDLRSDVGEIKDMLNRVSDAITKLALVEQQQNQIASSLERAFRALGKLEDRVSKLETEHAQSVPAQTETAKWVDRGLAALAGAGFLFVGKTLGL